MTVDRTAAENRLRHIDAPEPAQLACSLVDIPSATGHEVDLAGADRRS